MSNLRQINNELKVYINESSFISIKCRNRLLSIFKEEFGVDLDIDNYKNVDLSIKDDFKVLYREDLYDSNIKDIDDLNEKYTRFKERADGLIKRREIDFKNKSNLNNITNLIVVVAMFIFLIAVAILGIFAFINGHYFDCLWFLVFVVPWIFPKFKESLQNRIMQAKRYLKSLLKRVK